MDIINHSYETLVLWNLCGISFSSTLWSFPRFVFPSEWFRLRTKVMQGHLREKAQNIPTLSKHSGSPCAANTLISRKCAQRAFANHWLNPLLPSNYAFSYILQLLIFNEKIWWPGNTHKKLFLKSTEVKSRFLGRHNRSPIRIRGSTAEWPWSQWTWVWTHNSCETLACYEARSASATSHAHGKIMVPTPGALCRAKKSIQIKKRDTYVAHMRHLVIVTAIRSSLNVLLYYMIPLEEYSRRWENAPSERVPATVTAILSVWHRWQYKDLILKYVPIRHENTEGFERKHNCCIDFTTTHMIAQKTSFWATYNRL